MRSFGDMLSFLIHSFCPEKDKVKRSRWLDENGDEQKEKEEEEQRDQHNFRERIQQHPLYSVFLEIAQDFRRRLKQKQVARTKITTT